LAFAKTKLVDADLDIVSLKSTGQLHGICQRLNPTERLPVTVSREVLETVSDDDRLSMNRCDVCKHISKRAICGASSDYFHHVGTLACGSQ
jgi:hypothetical protein